MRGIINDIKCSFQTLKNNTEFKYDWSYIVAWIGVGLALIASILFSLAAVCIRTDKEREDAMNMQYLMPVYHQKQQVVTLTKANIFSFSRKYFSFTMNYFLFLHDKYYSTSKCLFQFAAGIPLRTLRLRGLPRPLLRVPVWPLQLLNTSHDRERHERTNNQKLPNGTEVLKRRSQCWTSCSKSWKCVFFHELFSSDFSVCRYLLDTCLISTLPLCGPEFLYGDCITAEQCSGVRSPGSTLRTVTPLSWKIQEPGHLPWHICPLALLKAQPWLSRREHHKYIRKYFNTPYPPLDPNQPTSPPSSHQSPSTLSIKPDGEVSIAYYF